ncbi:NB-ARC domain containing protein, partial [Trema orientale]
MASVVYDMAGKMVENLRCVADQSPGRLPRRIANELRKLADETSSIRQVLVDAEKKQAHDDKVRDWLAEVEDVLHDVENMVDELRFQVSRCGSRKPIITMREECKCFSICSDRLVFCRDIISDRRIKKCARELHRLGESRRLLDLEERLEEAAFGGLWKTISSSPRKSLNIGRESEKERILRYLLFSGDDQEGVPVLPIVGVGGFGKTMLAQLVYDDDMVRNHFDLRTWVHVSDSFDFTLLLRKLIQSANDSIAHMSSENVGDDSESMIVYFHSEILERRFLLVLDDMTMNENCTWGWEQFKGHLSSDAAKRAGSRIIVTTRDPAVARMTGTIESCELSGLNEDLSWSIFESFFPVGVRQMPSNVPVSEVGKKIVNKCGGNPFVIQAISGMLLFRDPETQWHVMEKDLSDIFQDGKDILSKTVELSYDDLPSNLKKCFGYCSLFPKDYEIDVQTLIKLWTSEGFIKLEEEGYECFLNLLWRSFFEESKRDEEEDKVTKCKMQNLLHDHAKSL